MQPLADTTIASQVRLHGSEIVPATDFHQHQQNDDITYNSWPDMLKMSLYCENVVGYIAGFVARKLQQTVTCSECAQVLTVNKDGQLSATYLSLVTMRDCGGLVYPSPDVVAVCKATESVFRSLMAPGSKPVYAANLKSSITTQIMGKLVGRELFNNLSEHLQTCEPTNDHRNQLLKIIIQQYLTVRLHHQARSYTRCVQGEKVRSFLNKTVTFKGQ